ncbi:glucose-1-phosphate thymidylyltransferase [Spirulina subsalsa FACHB-351]|uniref:Glucose-1-phosphate thymidylyltransferase n=1 Tax=Spirulina subsalsa FACHB-351 TaxID=234711 RepID=A0ABT3L724_9CYAN|nr:glucose-1-phosphate thymidylyltransferase [Spirulina subsalsa]MCW6037311.1 glucose-1-phosphate thymidylyltransferase [Spirulina subsalsa FACHB-351]
MKALILSGGKGTRLRPITYTGAKQLVPVANKPVLWYGIEAIVRAGITDLGLIISPETGEEVKTKTGDGSQFGAKITYILQEHPLGLAHAVQVAQPFLGNDPFLMYLGDNLIEEDLGKFVDQFTQQNLDALVLLRQVPDPRAFGVAKLDPAGNLLGVVEKPEIPPSNLALVGIFFFTAVVHEAIAKINPSQRGELEITDAIQTLINQQYTVQARELQGWWLDTGGKDDLLEANRIILDSYLTTHIEGQLDDQSRIMGRVQIGKGTTLIHCTVRGPAIIGQNCHLENCFVGPHSSIGNNVTLIDTDIDHSMILEGAQITNIHQRIIDSVIGQRAQLTITPRRPKALRFLIGDDCRVELTP